MVESGSDLSVNQPESKFFICLIFKKFYFHCFMWFCHLLVIYDWSKLAA